MQLNTRILYHNLLNIGPDADMPRALAYFKLFDQGPKAIIKAAETATGNKRYTNEQYTRLLQWWYSDVSEGSDQVEVMKARKSLDDDIGRLQESLKKK